MGKARRSMSAMDGGCLGSSRCHTMWIGATRGGVNTVVQVENAPVLPPVEVEDHGESSSRVVAQCFVISECETSALIPTTIL